MQGVLKGASPCHAVHNFWFGSPCYLKPWFFMAICGITPAPGTTGGLRSVRDGDHRGGGPCLDHPGTSALIWFTNEASLKKILLL